MLKKRIAYFIFTFLLIFSGRFASAEAICSFGGKEMPCDEVEELSEWLLGYGSIIILLLLLFFIIALVFWAIMIMHASFNPVGKKAFWISIMVLFGIIGAIVYYFVVKRKFDKENKVSQNLPAPAVPLPSMPSFK